MLTCCLKCCFYCGAWGQRRRGSRVACVVLISVCSEEWSETSGKRSPKLLLKTVSVHQMNTPLTGTHTSLPIICYLMFSVLPSMHAFIFLMRKCLFFCHDMNLPSKLFHCSCFWGRHQHPNTDCNWSNCNFLWMIKSSDVSALCLYSLTCTDVRSFSVCFRF